MRKYHLADVLTSLETLCAVILIGFAIGNVPVDYALWVFAAAELCDAFDGICARRWPYPDDGKRRTSPSAKLDAIQELVESCRDAGRKVLIFS